MEKPIFGLFATFQKPEEEKLSWSWLWSGFVVSIILFIALCCSGVNFGFISYYHTSYNDLPDYVFGLYQNHTTYFGMLNQYIFYFSIISFVLGIVVPYLLKSNLIFEKNRVPFWKKFWIPLEIIILLLAIDDKILSFPMARLYGGIACNKFLNNTIRVIMGETLYNDDTFFLVIYFFFLVLFWMFFYFLGYQLSALFQMGEGAYIKKRTLTYKLCKLIQKGYHEFVYEIVHYDFSRKNFTLILRVLLGNLVVLLVLFSVCDYFDAPAWVVRTLLVIYFGITLVFSAYFLSRIRKKYNNLFEATKNLAGGDLDINVAQDWGSFEPIKNELNSVSENVRVALENELRSQKMKTELITNVSHDLKTPLTTIITYVDLLKDENLSPETRSEYLQILDKKSQRLKVLIEDLFEVSKATSGNMKLDLHPVDILNLIRQVVFELDKQLKAPNLDIRYHFDEEKRILLLDSEKTYRIFENLFGNIAKYSLPGTRVYVESQKTDERYQIVLKNISAQELEPNPEHLTERFVRGDQSRNSEGSGLGLAIAKSFAEIQGGTMDVETDGDLFKVILKFMIKELPEKEEK